MSMGSCPPPRDGRLQGQAPFECMESKFSIARGVRQGSVEAPCLWQKNGHAALGKSGRRLGEEKNGRFLVWKDKEPTRFAVSCELTTSGSCPIRRLTSNRC